MIATESSHYVKGLDPIANAFGGTVRSDVVNLSIYGHAEFILFWGVGATGTTLITVEASDNVTPTGNTAIPFKYRVISTGDTPGTVQDAAAAGFTTTAGSSQIIVVEVNAADLGGSGKKYVSLKAVEQTVGALMGGILIRLSNPRYAEALTDTAIV